MGKFMQREVPFEIAGFHGVSKGNDESKSEFWPVLQAMETDGARNRIILSINNLRL